MSLAVGWAQLSVPTGQLLPRLPQLHARAFPRLEFLYPYRSTDPRPWSVGAFVKPGSLRGMGLRAFSDAARKVEVAIQMTAAFSLTGHTLMLVWGRHTGLG